MPIGQRQKKLKWYREKVAAGCEICGRKIPGLKNSGLHASHIVSGVNHKDNILALCPSCHTALDEVLKPAIADALRAHTGARVPKEW